MFKAKQIMTTDIVCVKRDTPVYEAMKILVDKGVTGLPVVSDDMRLLGIISEKDLLQLLYETRVDKMRVEDLMSKEVASFDEEDDLVDICECLIKRNFRRVPILSKGKLVGIISRRDVIKYILKVRKADA